MNTHRVIALATLAAAMLVLSGCGIERRQDRREDRRDDRQDRRDDRRDDRHDLRSQAPTGVYTLTVTTPRPAA